MIRYKSRQNTKGDRALITGAFNRYTDLAPGVQEPVALRQRYRDKDLGSRTVCCNFIHCCAAVI